MNYKVSIIIPVYGVEDYIGKCIESVINQTLKEIQIIVVDDCSPDKSISILEDKINNSFRKNDTIIIRKPENEGLSFARKTGLEYATGEYIIHLDSDDYYYNNDIIEKLYNKAKEGNYDILEGDFIEEKESGEKKYYKRNIDHISPIKYIDLLFSREKLPSIWGILIRKTLYNNFIIFDKELSWGEDLIHKIQLLYHSKNIYYYRIPIINYLQRKSSITNDKNKSLKNKQLLRSIAIVDKFFKEKNICIESIIAYKLWLRMIILRYSIFNNDLDYYKNIYKNEEKKVFTNKYIFSFKLRMKLLLFFYMFPLLKRYIKYKSRLKKWITK